jgi:hypothetical protein
MRRPSFFVVGAPGHFAEEIDHRDALVGRDLTGRRA